MRKFRILTIVALAVISLAANAQSDVDALRYSMIGFGGTARYSGMGGAFGAIGADFSTISVNPAGLGVYRKSEFTFTPSLYTGKTSSTYNGNTAEDKKYNFNLSNLGIVFARDINKGNDKEGWKSVNFAFGLNRYNNFNNRMVIEGMNQTSSLMDVYRTQANGYKSDNLDPFSTQLAYNTYLLDTTIQPTIYTAHIPDGAIKQTKTVQSSGAMQEMVFSLGANYNNKLYIGGTIGVPYIRYKEQSSYKEVGTDSTTATNFSNFTLGQNLNTTGTGFNFKFGLIYVPVDVDMLKVKIGAAIHTPTFFTMHDEWSSTMKSNFYNGNYYSDESPKGKFDYDLTTPMRAIGSLAIQIGQYGTLSADYEFVDYSEAQLSSKTDDFIDANGVIQNKYTATNNLRFGAEVALGLFSIRGGYAMYNSPFKSGLNDAKTTAITGGVGIIDKNFFIDLGYIYASSNEDYYLYNYTDMTPANLKKIKQNFVMTLGFKF
jgi:hypothetical protein